MSEHANPHPGPDRRQRRRPWLQWAQLGLILALVAYITVSAVLNSSEATVATEERDQAVGQVKDFGADIAESDVCKSTDPTIAAQFAFVCEQARHVASQAKPDPVDTEALAAAVTSIVLAGLPSRVDAAVAAYLERNPPPAGKSATPEQIGPAVAAAVTSYLAANPPAPGRSPTSGEVAQIVAAEVAAYFVRNPPQAGPEGKPGKDAPPPTQEQVDEAVARYFQTHPANPCPGVWRPTTFRDDVAGYRCENP